MKHITVAFIATIFYTTALFAATGNIQISADVFELDGQKNLICASGNVFVTQQNIKISGRTALYNQAKNSVQISDHVRLEKDHLTVLCDRLVANGTANTIQAFGNIQLSFTDATGQAETAFYDLTKNLITLSGKPLLQRRKDSLTGDQIIIDLKTERITTKGQAKAIFTEDNWQKQK